MIEVTRINGTKIMINSDIIEMMEETPDTVITLTNGHKYIVSEKTVSYTHLTLPTILLV
mgnify:CR=1 FL=1